MVRRRVHVHSKVLLDQKGPPGTLSLSLRPYFFSNTLKALSFLEHFCPLLVLRCPPAIVILPSRLYNDWLVYFYCLDQIHELLLDGKFEMVMIF